MQLMYQTCIAIQCNALCCSKYHERHLPLGTLGVGLGLGRGLGLGLGRGLGRGLLRPGRRNEMKGM